MDFESEWIRRTERIRESYMLLKNFNATIEEENEKPNEEIETLE